MKSLITLFLLTISVSTFAKDPASLGLLNIIPVGTYSGVTNENQECNVEVKYIVGYYQSFTLITAKTENETVSYATNNSTDYSINTRLGKQFVLFLQLELDQGTETSSVRIVRSNINTMNVSIGNYTYENRNRNRTSAEISCNI